MDIKPEGEKECDICRILYDKHQAARVDGALSRSGRDLVGGYAWANLCLTHHRTYGVGFGTGKGQFIKSFVTVI